MYTAQNIGRNQWNGLLSRYVGSTSASQKAAIECSMSALAHFAACGDVVYCTELFDNMPKNFHRRDAFVKWLVAHAPIKLEKDKITSRYFFSKDKEKKDQEVHLEAAEKEPFWEFAPAKEDFFFDYTDAVQAAIKAVTKFKNGKHYKAKSAEEALKVEKLVNMLEGFRLATTDRQLPKAEEIVTEEPVMQASEEQKSEEQAETEVLDTLVTPETTEEKAAA